MNELIQFAKVLDQRVIFGLQGSEEPFSCIDRISKEDLIKLTNDINSIKQESQLALISALLKKHEPDIMDEIEQMEIDVNLLKPTTLRLVRDKVDQIIHG